MGFWHQFTNGQSTWNDRIIRTLMEAQKEGKANPHPERILKNVNQFPQLPKGQYNGHAAWNQWPWKLHRIQSRGNVKLELYNLEKDPMEATDLSLKQPERTKSMRTDLEAWQASVFNSLEGKDYTKK